MARIVLDSSAVVAMLLDEPGASMVSERVSSALISAVNMAEVISKLSDEQFSQDQTGIILNDLKLEVIPFDSNQAMTCGLLRTKTRHRGLSLGDRACLALAIQENATVLTADRIWAELDIGIKIELIR